MKYNFYDYLHSNSEGDENKDFYEGQGLPAEVAQAIAESDPFYEIRLDCEYDSTTGRTTIISVSST